MDKPKGRPRLDKAEQADRVRLGSLTLSKEAMELLRHEVARRKRTEVGVSYSSIINELIIKCLYLLARELEKPTRTSKAKLAVAG